MPVERAMEEDDEMVLVAPPEDARQRAVIDLLAEFIATDGDAFEKVRQWLIQLRHWLINQWSYVPTVS